MDLFYIVVFDQLDFHSKGVIEISEPILEQDEETNSTSSVKIKKYDNFGNKINYNIQELDLIFVRKNKETIYNGVVTKISDGDNFVQISFKDIINIFDEQISTNNGLLNTIQKNVGIEDALASAISTFWTSGYYGQNSINTNVTTHTPVNANIPAENGIFNLATYMNNVKMLYDIAIDFDFKLIDSTTEDYRLIANIYKKNVENKRIIDLKICTNVEEVYNSTVLAIVTAIGPNQESLIYCLHNDRTIKPYGEDLGSMVFGKKTTIYVDDWSTAVQEITNQFKGNRYDHLYQFQSNQEYEINEPVILVTESGEKVESYITSKKWLSNGFEYKTGKIRVKFLDKFLKERRG